MAILHPFKALRPSPKEVEEIACVPYDVVSAEEARTMASGNKKSFLHVIRPEIDLPADITFNDDRVYEKGRENLQNLIDQKILKRDADQAVYIYRLKWQKSIQTGIFGCVSVDDYDNEVILKHELTRPDKEDDRTRHIVTQSAHAEPVMMTYRDKKEIDDFVDQFTSSTDPLYNFTADDGVTHILWKVSDPSKLVEAFSPIDSIYIADGHHRCKSASRAAKQLKKQNPDHTGTEEYNFFPAVLFPMSQMNILPYNRLIHSVPEDFDQKLTGQFNLTSTSNPTPQKKGNVCIYRDGQWQKMELPVSKNPNSVEKLDAYRLQKFILEPMLGIEDPRTNNNISFVGGIRGTKELEKRVDDGDAELAISMYPTAIEELAQVSDEHLLMPPKSTWFEPKLRSGLLVHTF